MSSKPLLGLSIRAWSSEEEQVALIFAEPTYSDLESLAINKEYLKLLEGFLCKPCDANNTQPDDEAKIEADDVVVKLENVEDDEFRTEKRRVTEHVQDIVKGQHEDVDIEYDSLEENSDSNDEETSEAENKKKRKNGMLLDKYIKKVGEHNFVCSECNKSFKYKNNARKHVRLHGIDPDGAESVEKRTCPHCNKICTTKMGLKKHLRRESCPDRKVHTCKHCNRQLESQERLREHRQQEHGDLYECSYCEYKAGYLSVVKKHEKKMHLDVKCKLCKVAFKSEAEAQAHTCQAASQQPPPVQEVFHCDQCDRRYKSKYQLFHHIKYSHIGKIDKCEICNTELTAPGSLKRHMKTVHGPEVRKFKCDICGMLFKANTYLVRHKKLHSMVEKPHMCTHCGKRFTAKHTLDFHIDKIHLKIESTKHCCEDCGKGFETVSQLKIHAEYKHSKGELVMCQLCGAEMVGNTKLKRHMISMHRPGIKFVACDHCGKSVQATKLKNHIVEAHKSHSFKFQCSYCHMKFPVKPSIREHIRTHTGARPYVCQGCEKGFVNLQSLKRHIRERHDEDYSLTFYDISKDINNPYAGTVVK